MRIIESPIGPLEAKATSESLLSLNFIDKEDARYSSTRSILLDLLEDQLAQYFNGERTMFDIPIDPSGTEFQQRIWKLIDDIEFGQTSTYQRLSSLYGDENAIRAVAGANGANPIAIIIPCHRVLGTDGSLTGYSGGLWRKEYLLDLERGQQSLF